MGAADDEDKFCIPKPQLDLDKNWRLRAETELNETSEKAKENMKLLTKKLLADKSMYSRTDEAFLMAFLRGRKHNVDAAYKLIKSYYEMKNSYPEFYKECLPSEKGHIYEMGFLSLIPGEDKAGSHIAACVVAKMDFTNLRLEEIFQLGASVFESALLNPEIQIGGISVIVDLNEMTLYQQARLINPRFAWQITNCIQEKIPVRIRGIHILNQPIYYNALYAIFKPFLKRKLRKRIHFHGSDMNSLHQFISPKYLPPEWGGEGPEYSAKAITRVVRNNEANLVEWKKYGVNKSRPQDDEEK